MALDEHEYKKLLDRMTRLERRMTALESRIPPPQNQTRMRNPNREQLKGETNDQK